MTDNTQYYKKEYLIHNGSGVCVVEDISTLDTKTTSRAYYTLKPLLEESCRIYVPTDNTACIIRRVLTKKDALALVESIPLIEAMQLDDNKVKDIYKTALKTNDTKSWISLIKAIRLKFIQTEIQKKVPNSLDESYLKRVSLLVFSELSVTLGISVKQAEELVSERIFA